MIMHSGKCYYNIKNESGEMNMMNYYISELNNILEKTVPKFINEKNFLLIAGSIFLLGVVTKWLVMRNYAKLIRRAENINQTKNATIRQIKIKYDSIMNVSGKMENPILFVQRHINKCKVMHISLNKLGNIINYCSVLIVGISAIVAYQLYDEVPTKIDWITCLFMGCFLGMTLDMINRTMPTAEMKMELVYVVSDSLVNGEDRVRKELLWILLIMKILRCRRRLRRNWKRSRFLIRLLGNFCNKV